MAKIAQNNAQIIQLSNYQLQSEDARRHVGKGISDLQNRNEELLAEVAQRQREMWMYSVREAES